MASGNIYPAQLAVVQLPFTAKLPALVLTPASGAGTMLRLPDLRSMASCPGPLVSDSRWKPEMMRVLLSGSISGSINGLSCANSAAASTRDHLWVKEVVWSVRAGALWHAPHRAERNCGFFNEALDPKKISNPSNGSGSFELGVRVPPAGTRCVHVRIPVSPLNVSCWMQALIRGWPFVSFCTGAAGVPTISAGL